MSETQNPTGPFGAPTPGPPPAMATPPPTYPVPPTREPSGQGRRWLVPLLVGLVALVVGAGIGYAASIPGTNSTRDDRTAALAQVRDLQTKVNDLQSSVGANQTARDTCTKAATDASDLVDQYDNFLSDFQNYLATEPGSAAEAQWIQHMDDQWARMEQQYDTVKAELQDCKAAVS